MYSNASSPSVQRVVYTRLQTEPCSERLNISDYSKALVTRLLRIVVNEPGDRAAMRRAGDGRDLFRAFARYDAYGA